MIICQLPQGCPSLVAMASGWETEGQGLNHGPDTSKQPLTPGCLETTNILSLSAPLMMKFTRRIVKKIF